MFFFSVTIVLFILGRLYFCLFIKFIYLLVKIYFFLFNKLIGEFFRFFISIIFISNSYI